MPILLVFLLIATCLPIEWPEPLVGPSRSAGAGLTALVILLPLMAAFTLRTWVVHALRRRPERRIEVAQSYSHLRRVLFFVNMGAVAAAILVLGWGWTVQQTLVVERDGDVMLAPFAELAVSLPYFLLVFGCWLIYYDAERMLHRSMVASHGEFWSRAGYFLHHLRQLALLIVLPVGLFVTQQSFMRIWPETSRADWYRVASIAVVPVLILLMPLMIKPLLGLQSLPAGPVRQRFESLARRLNFRYADLLIWPTRGASVNAMIVGLVPQVRYVIFTDRILEDLPPDELDAVFGHEVGHAKHGHIWFYAAFLILSITVLAALFLLAAQSLDAAGVKVPEQYLGWLTLPPVAITGAYVFLVFGFLSRRCERQADVYGCRAVSCGDLHCEGHTSETVYPADGRGLCPTGIRTCARALERVDLLNGFGGPEFYPPQRSVGGLIRAALSWLRAWLHSPMPRRIRFLLSLIDDPDRERRFQWRVTLLRWGLLLGLATALVALGEAIGWHALLESL